MSPRIRAVASTVRLAAETVPSTVPASRASSATILPEMMPSAPWISWAQRTLPSMRPSTWSWASVARSPLMITSEPMMDMGCAPFLPGLAALGCLVANMEGAAPARDYVRAAVSGDQARCHEVGRQRDDWPLKSFFSYAESAPARSPARPPDDSLCCGRPGGGAG